MKFAVGSDVFSPPGKDSEEISVAKKYLTGDSK